MTLLFDFDPVNSPLNGANTLTAPLRVIKFEPNAKSIILSSWYKQDMILAYLPYSRLKTFWWSSTPRVHSVAPVMITKGEKSFRAILLDSENGLALWDPNTNDLELFVLEIEEGTQNSVLFTTIIFEIQASPMNAASIETCLCVVSTAGEVLWWNMNRLASCIRLHLRPPAPIIYSYVARLDACRVILVVMDATLRVLVLELSPSQVPSISLSFKLPVNYIGIGPLDSLNNYHSLVAFARNSWLILKVDIANAKIEVLETFELPKDLIAMSISSSLIIANKGDGSIWGFDCYSGQCVFESRLADDASIKDVQLHQISDGRFLSLGLRHEEAFINSKYRAESMGSIVQPVASSEYDFLTAFDLLAEFNFSAKNLKMSCWRQLVMQLKILEIEFPTNWNELRKIFDMINSNAIEKNQRIVTLLILYLVEWGQASRFVQFATVCQVSLALQLEARYYVSLDRAEGREDRDDEECDGHCIVPVPEYLSKDFILSSSAQVSADNLNDADDIKESLKQAINQPKLYRQEFQEFQSRSKNKSPVSIMTDDWENRFGINWNVPPRREPIHSIDQINMISATRIEAPDIIVQKPNESTPYSPPIVTPARIATSSRLAAEIKFSQTPSRDSTCTLTASSSPSSFQGVDQSIINGGESGKLVLQSSIDNPLEIKVLGSDEAPIGESPIRKSPSKESSSSSSIPTTVTTRRKKKRNKKAENLKLSKRATPRRSKSKSGVKTNSYKNDFPTSETATTMTIYSALSSSHMNNVESHPNSEEMLQTPTKYDFRESTIRQLRSSPKSSPPRKLNI